MPPDLNSLPPSPSPNTQTPLHQSRSSSMAEAIRQSPHRNGRSISPTPSPSTHTLAAAATMNAGLQSEEQRSSGSSLRHSARNERRRSSVRMSLSLNDPALPGPGEIAISPAYRAHAPPFSNSPPYHQRAPSLGELHQELENEQEAQVNRLLQMIRQQQSQIQTLQSQQSGSTAIDDSATPSEASRSHTPAQTSASISHTRPAFSSSRHSSHRSSDLMNHETSPSIRPMSGAHASEELASLSPSTRDESAFYQAETQSLTRENQMLKIRIRELERQLNETSMTSSISHSPTTSSNLHTAPVGNERVPSDGSLNPRDPISQAERS